MISQFLDWVAKLLIKIASIILNRNNNNIDFLVLVGRIDRKKARESLDLLDIEVLSETKQSDYISCRASVNNFCDVFRAKVKWKPYLAGSWEVKKAEPLRSMFKKEGFKCVLVKRDILLPHGFIKNADIK